MNIREYSRNEYTAHGTWEDVKIGCLQRIADSMETIAKGYSALERDRDMYKRWYEERGETIARFSRQINALRGVITKMKRGR